MCPSFGNVFTHNTLGYVVFVTLYSCFSPPLVHLRSYSIPGLFCYDKYSFNLFHFYVDMLPKLCFAEKSSCKRLYIPSSLSGFTHVMEITQLLGFECIFFDERPLNIFVSSRLVSHQGYSFSTFRSCRDNILSKLESRLTHEPILTQQIYLYLD